MSKRIVVGLDGSPYSNVALQFAIRRAKYFRATLVGVAVIDRPSIEHLQVGMQPGAMHISHEAVTARLNLAKSHATELIHRFRTICEAEDLEHEDIIHTGRPHDVLLEEGKAADLIMLGVRTFFSHETQDEPDDTLFHVLKSPVCPVLAVTESMELPHHVIFAYDGSPGAARAMQAYVHVTPNWPEDLTASLLCASSDFARSKFAIEKALHYLRAHRIHAEVIMRSDAPVNAIITLAKERAPALLVVGKPMKSGIAELLFGTIANAIIKEGTLPVFFYN